MKKKIISIIAALALVVALAAGLTACGNNDKTDWDYIQSRGKMIVGYTNYPPLDIKVDGKLQSGFDYELALAVGKKLGIDVEFKEIVWANKTIDLNAKKIDCIWNGMTITPELQENLSLSKPYLRNRQAVVVKANETRYSDLESLRGAKIGAEMGSAGASFIEDNNLNPNYSKEETQLRLFANLDSGINDVVVMDSIMAGYYLTLEDFQGKYKVLENVGGEAEQFAIGFRKGDTEFTAKVDTAIAELKADGTVARLAEKYGLTSEIL